MRYLIKFFRRGFTLIELLIVCGILAILLTIVLIAVNPLEMFNKTHDIATQSITKDFASAAKYYYAEEKASPWVKSTACAKELESKDTVDQMTSCVGELTQDGDLQSKVVAANESKDVHMTQCNDGIALCYQPKSNQFKNTSEAKYANNGARKEGCPGGEDCYVCTFTTNQVQECLQALNPNAVAEAVSPNQPVEVVPLPDRLSDNLCDSAAEGKAACMAEVVTDSSGNPLSSLALPSGLSPAQLHTAYNLPCTPGGPVKSSCTTPGSFGPQTVAVILAYHSPTIESDLAVYSQTYDLPPCTTANGCLRIVNQNGATSPVPSVDSLWALEAALDVQTVHGICQTCKILVVEANSNSFLDLGIATKTAGSMGVTAISNSYGNYEWSGSTAYDQYYDQPGIAVTASSGDWGYGALYPASSKKVIAVGGTTLTLNSDNSYAAETVWNGAGSGCSGYQTANAYQTSLSNWNLMGCGSRKGIADVSAVASPNSGAAIYNSTQYSGRWGWWVVGGTSLSSPLYASVIALQNGIPAGSDGSAFPYANASKFRDVVSGSNGGCGTIACNAAVGFDGPTGLGSPNLLPSGANPIPSNTPAPTIAVTPTSFASPSATPGLPTPSPTPTLTPSPTAEINCNTQQTVRLTQSQPILALPGDTVNNALTVTSNDSPSCSSLYTVSHGYPTGWTFAGIPASFTLAGGATKTVNFTIAVPSNATAGNYGYQFWVAKQGQSSVNPVNGSVQVAQVGPTNTPTPTPINCFQGWSNSLGSTSMSGNAGDTISQTLTITYLNPAVCGAATFAISHSYPSGWVIHDLPPSVQLTGGQSVTIPFTITISTGAQVQDYTLQYWINSGGLPMNATVHVLHVATPPEEQLFSNFNTKLYANYATFEYSYNASGNVSGRLDVSTDPNGLNTTTNPPAATRFGFAFNSGSAWDATNTAGPSTVRGFIVSSPQSWTGWQCGATIYYRMYNSGDLRIKSPVQSGVVDCNTQVNVLPWTPWYSAIYQGVYDSRYDADNNGVINYTDYWILVRATKLR